MGAIDKALSGSIGLGKAQFGLSTLLSVCTAIAVCCAALNLFGVGAVLPMCGCGGAAAGVAWESRRGGRGLLGSVLGACAMSETAILVLAAWKTGNGGFELVGGGLSAMLNAPILSCLFGLPIGLLHWYLTRALGTGLIGNELLHSRCVARLGAYCLAVVLFSLTMFTR